MTTTPAAEADITYVAEDAPLGVQLWPTISAEYAPNFTLLSVTVTRDVNGEWVTWTYESGMTRLFVKGEAVMCRVTR